MVEPTTTDGGIGCVDRYVNVHIMPREGVLGEQVESHADFAGGRCAEITT
jgi:hypothetical protein